MSVRTKFEEENFRIAEYSRKTNTLIVGFLCFVASEWRDALIDDTRHHGSDYCLNKIYE